MASGSSKGSSFFTFEERDGIYLSYLVKGLESTLIGPFGSHIHPVVGGRGSSALTGQAWVMCPYLALRVGPVLGKAQREG